MTTVIKRAKLAILGVLAFILVAPFGVFFPALGAYNPASLVGVATVATLRAGNYIPYPYIYLVGYISFGDGGEGVLGYNSGSSAADNGCTLFRDSSAHVFQRLGVENVLNVDQCGATGTGTTDDTAAINRAFAASTHAVCSSGKTYEVMGLLLPIANATVDFASCTIAVNETGSAANAFMNIAVSGVTVENLHAIRTSGGGGSGGGAGIQVGTTATANNTQIINFFCDSSALATELAECIRIGSGTNLLIDRFQAKSTGYGIIQLSNGFFSTVKVTNAIATDMYSDFFEQNAGAGGRMNDVLLDNITFNGSHDWPTGETEERFAGFTSVFDLTISNSHVKNAAGDACVHLEGTSTHIKIIGSTFWDCQVSGGNDGFIYVLTSTANINLTGNWFIVDNAYTCSGCYALGDGTGAYSNSITAAGNTIVDLNGAHQIGGFDLSGYTGNADIVGNTMQGGATFVVLFSSGTTSTNINISSNNVASSTNGVYSANAFTSGGSGGTNIDVRDNTFSVSGYSVVSGTNTNSTLPPVNWTVTGNKSLGAGLGTLIFNGVNTFGGDNWYASGLTNTSVAVTGGTATIECYDFKQGTGIIHKCP